jgi:tRNA (guanine-N7-)-methyltransferase
MPGDREPRRLPRPHCVGHDTDGVECGAEVPSLPRRSVRSFVLRQGRMTPAQRCAFELLLPRYGLAFEQSPLDFAKVFGRTAPVVLEIGFGMGETTAAIAAAHPDQDFLGVEVHAPGVGSLLRRVDASRLTNVRVIRHDAVEVVEQMIPLASLAGVHVFFPDPWPKKRHHKRRLLQPGFVHALAERLVAGGYLHAATDWAPYADAILATFAEEVLLENTAAGFAPRPAWRPQTKFESRGEKLGHAVADIVFRRVDVRPAEALPPTPVSAARRPSPTGA